LCGSITSFSTLNIVATVALLNEDTLKGGYSVLAWLSVLVIDIGMSLIGYSFGTHLYQLSKSESVLETIPLIGRPSIAPTTLDTSPVNATSDNSLAHAVSPSPTITNNQHPTNIETLTFMMDGLKIRSIKTIDVITIIIGLLTWLAV